MARSVGRWGWIGIVLSVAWLLGATAVLDHQRGVEVRRLARECHQLQADARASKLCGATDAAVAQPLCRFKDADCDHWPFEEERYAKNIAWVAAAPVAVAWVMFYGFVRVFRRSDKP